MASVDWFARLVELNVIRNTQKLELFNKRLLEQENLSHAQALAIYEALHQEAILLKAIGPETIMDGLEVDLKIARAINGLKT